jgi:hypothetical protein
MELRKLDFVFMFWLVAQQAIHAVAEMDLTKKRKKDFCPLFAVSGQLCVVSDQWSVTRASWPLVKRRLPGPDRELALVSPWARLSP